MEDMTNKGINMSKSTSRKSKRRSISVKAVTYQRLSNFCGKHGKSLSGFIEEVVSAHLDSMQEPIPTVIKQPETKKPLSKDDIDEISGQHFTF
jgi:macrodomain Ter protein organizer (MatP/YcbG family)